MKVIKKHTTLCFRGSSNSRLPCPSGRIGGLAGGQQGLCIFSQSSREVVVFTGLSRKIYIPFLKC